MCSHLGISVPFIFSCHNYPPCSDLLSLPPAPFLLHFILHTSAGFLFLNITLVTPPLQGLVILYVSISHLRSSEHIGLWTRYMFDEKKKGICDQIYLRNRIEKSKVSFSTSYNLWCPKNSMWIFKLECFPNLLIPQHFLKSCFSPCVLQCYGIIGHFTLDFPFRRLISVISHWKVIFITKNQLHFSLD